MDMLEIYMEDSFALANAMTRIWFGSFEITSAAMLNLMFGTL